MNHFYGTIMIFFVCLLFQSLSASVFIHFKKSSLVFHWNAYMLEQHGIMTEFKYKCDATEFEYQREYNP